MADYTLVPVEHDPFGESYPSFRDMGNLLTGVGSRVANAVRGMANPDNTLAPVKDAFAREAAGQPYPAGQALPLAGGKDPWALSADAGMVGTAKNSLSLPGDVAAGRVDPMSDVGIARAHDLVGLLGGRGLAKPEEGIGVFAGMGSKTADFPALNKAMQSNPKGGPTGMYSPGDWFRGPDGKWKYEIPDTPKSSTDWGGKVGWGEHGPPMAGMQSTLGNILDHPELYAAYPDLKDMKVSSKDLGPSRYGEFNPSTGELALNSKLAPDTQMSVLLHEIQHGIQQKEGFAAGTNPEDGAVKQFTAQHDPETIGKFREFSLGMDRIRDLAKTAGVPLEQYLQKNAFLKPLYDDLRGKADQVVKKGYMNTYQREAGEVEARNVQARAQVVPTAAGDTMLLNRHPLSTMDVPAANQLMYTPDYTKLQPVGAK